MEGAGTCVGRTQEELGLKGRDGGGDMCRLDPGGVRTKGTRWGGDRCVEGAGTCVGRTLEELGLKDEMGR